MGVFCVDTRLVFSDSVTNELTSTSGETISLVPSPKLSDSEEQSPESNSCSHWEIFHCTVLY